MDNHYTFDSLFILLCEKFNILCSNTVLANHHDCQTIDYFYSVCQEWCNDEEV